MRTLNYLHSAAWFLPVRILLSIVYFFLTEMRNRFYDWGVLPIHRIDTPIVSVGNISAGGSGKTIMVQTLIRFFQDNHMSPAVLSRGYGRETKGLLLVADKNGLNNDVRSSGDEPYLIARNCPGIPVLVSEDRALGAKYLLEESHPDVIILDDGFQHRRLYRDLDILLYDRQKDIPSHILPWGNLRESEKNTRRADLILNSKSGLQGNVSHDFVVEIADKLVGYDGEMLSFSDVSGSYGLFAGLGNNPSFFSAVESVLGIPKNKHSFPDHTSYSVNQRNKILESDCDIWITTQKDFVKLNPGFCEENNIYYLPVMAKAPGALELLLKQYFKL
jgi:tetraacyldisaccharide 4'-kinase